MKKFIYLSLVYFLSFGCNDPSSQLTAFSVQNWKADPQGCNNLRVKETDHLKELQNAIIGRGENDVIKVLGKPNRHILGERMTKIYIYYLTAECTPTTSFPKTWLKVNFNSVSQVKDVIIEDSE